MLTKMLIQANQMDVNSYKTNPKARCMECGAALDGQTSITGERPRVGDISICAYCSTVGYFVEGLFIRPMTESELRFIKLNLPQVWKQLQFQLKIVSDVRKERKRAERLSRRKKGRRR